jgi:hypothetical protein
MWYCQYMWWKRTPANPAPDGLENGIVVETIAAPRWLRRLQRRVHRRVIMERVLLTRSANPIAWRREYVQLRRMAAEVHKAAERAVFGIEES